MKISVFVFGLLVASSSAIRGHESRFRNLEREVAFSDEEIDNAWALKIAGRRLHAKEDTPSKAPSTAIPSTAVFSTAVPSTAPWKKVKGGKGSSSPTINDPPEAAGVDSNATETPAPTPVSTGYGTYSGKDGDGGTKSPKAPTSVPSENRGTKSPKSPTSVPSENGGRRSSKSPTTVPSEDKGTKIPKTSTSVPSVNEGTKSPKDGSGPKTPKDGESDSPSSAPSSGEKEDGGTPSDNGPSSGNDENSDTTGRGGDLTREVQCDADESAFQDLTPKFVTYEYTVETSESSTLKEVLAEIESTIILSFSEENVLGCSDQRRRLNGALRISADPPDVPFNKNVDCTYDCNMKIQGNLTAYADEGTDLQGLQCDIITVIQQVLNTMVPGEIDGLKSITYNGKPMCETEVVKETNTSNSLPTGLIVGTAVGGMCMVLLGLLAMRRRRMSRSREDNTTLAGMTKEINNSHSVSETVDQTFTQETISPVPTNLEGTIDSTLGISASPDDCSVWGENNPKFTDIEAARGRCNSGTSEITTSFGLISQAVSLDPSMMDNTTSCFEPAVHEEEHLTHDVANLPAVSGADSSVAAGTDILVETNICADSSPALAHPERFE